MPFRNVAAVGPLDGCWNIDPMPRRPPIPLTPITRSRPSTAPGPKAAMTPPGRSVPLDGVRGLAVLAVLVFHAFPDVLPGGFLGVDVFFVLSGYLITTGLTNQLLGSGRIALGTFWIRRARRLLPALLTMLLGTTAVSLAAGPNLPAGLRAQWLGAITYLANWQQIIAGNSYFAATDPPLFQHLWSLAIEEQFYLVWPVLLLVAVRWLTSWRRAAWLTGALAVASSVAMALSYTGSNASRLYFGTDTHGFGLLAGAAAALALAGRSTPRVPAGLRSSRSLGADAAGLGVLVLLVVGMALVSGESAAAYRGGMAGATIAATALVFILRRSPSVLSHLLSLPPLVWCGRRSYALYLWHWPLLVIGWSVFPPEAKPAAGWAMLAVTMLIAAASWVWLEAPIQREGFRANFRKASSWLRSGLPGGGLNAPWHRRQVGVLVCVSIVLCGAACAATSLVRSPTDSLLQQQIAAAQSAIQDTAGSDAVPDPPAPPRGSSPGPSAPAAQHPSDPPRAGTSDAPVPPEGRIRGTDISAIGDSVMLAAAPGLLEQFPGIRIKAEVGAQMWDSSQILTSLNTSGRLRKVLVVGLGTNGDFSATQLEALIDSVGTEHRVLLTTVHAPRPWAGAVNDKLRAAAASHANVHLVEWDAQAGQVKDFARDGIHPGPQGAQIYAQAIVQALNGF